MHRAGPEICERILTKGSHPIFHEGVRQSFGNLPGSAEPDNVPAFVARYFFGYLQKNVAAIEGVPHFIFCMILGQIHENVL